MRDTPLWLGIVGILLYLPTGFLYASSGLLVPLWGLVVLWLIWLVGLGLVVWAARSRPPLTLLGLPLAAVVWFLFVSAGEAFLGWTG